MGHGDLFPVPLPSVEAPANRALCRGTRQRVQRRRAVQLARHAAVSAVNSLSGSAPAGTDNSSSGVTDGQGSFLDYLDLCIGESVTSPLAPQEALKTLLHTDSLYDDARSVTVAPFNCKKISFPEFQTRACPLTDHLEGDAKVDLGNFKSCMLLNSEEVAGRSDSHLDSP